jgi:hypothetical protein
MRASRQKKTARLPDDHNRLLMRTPTRNARAEPTPRESLGGTCSGANEFRIAGARSSFASLDGAVVAPRS